MSSEHVSNLVFYAQSTISREHKKRTNKQKRRRRRKSEKHTEKERRRRRKNNKKREKKVIREQPRCRRTKEQTCRKVESTDSPELLDRHNQSIRYVWLPFEAQVDRLIGRRSQ